MKIGLLATLLLSFACLFACGPSRSNERVQEFPVRGEVLKLDSGQRLATIRHGKIEGWMEAMTMDFPVRQGEDLAKLNPGARIEATVFVQGLTFHIGNIRSVPAAK